MQGSTAHAGTRARAPWPPCSRPAELSFAGVTRGGVAAWPPRSRECFGCSRGSGTLETTFLSAPHKSCNGAALVSHSGWVSSSLAWSCLYSLTHSFVQPVGTESFSCAGFWDQVHPGLTRSGPSPGAEVRLGYVMAGGGAPKAIEVVSTRSHTSSPGLSWAGRVASLVTCAGVSQAWF